MAKYKYLIFLYSILMFSFVTLFFLAKKIESNNFSRWKLLQKPILNHKIRQSMTNLFEKTQEDSCASASSNDEETEPSQEKYYARLAGYVNRASAEAYLKVLQGRGIPAKLYSFSYITPRKKQKRYWFQVCTLPMKFDEVSALVEILKRTDRLSECIICKSEE